MRKDLRLILLLSVILISLPAISQQDYQFSQFSFNKLIYNPATAGKDDALNATAFYRNQWVGLPGHPITQSIAVSLPLYRISSGVGVSFINESAGVERNMEIKAAYAYLFNTGNGILSFGINAGIIQKNLDGDKLITPDGIYQDNVQLDHNDPLLPDNKVSALAPDLGAGVYFANQRFNIGVAVNHILEPKVSFELKNGNTEFQYNRHLNLIAGYKFRISRAIEIQPSILAKSDLAVHQLDINTLVIYNRNFWGGLSFRGYNNNSKDAVIGMIGMNLTNKISFGYSYDFNLSALQSANSGSHEVFLNYRLPIERQSQGKIINNPRFLYN